MKKISLLFLVLILAACSSKELSVKQATGLLKSYAEKNPVFETTTIDIGERKLRLNKDALEIEHLKQLQEQDLLLLSTTNMRKKFLAKDSIWVVNVALTTHASPFIVDQKKSKAEVKTYLFTIQENADVELKLTSKTKATAKAKLIKEPTPFAVLGKDKNPNTAFIVRDFNLRYKEETGWFVQK